MDQKIFFIHIPKTAGTSFRVAARKYFGDDNTFFDYGERSSHTSMLIRQHVYTNPDMDALGDALAAHQKFFIGGHVPATRYTGLIGLENAIAFVRDPVDQVISHYKHYVMEHSYQKDLVSFVENRKFRNLQSRFLADCELEDIGFVGLTAHYRKSIQVINTRFRLDLKVHKMNVRKVRGLSRKRIDPRIIKRIEDLNRKDMCLVEQAEALFHERYGS